MSGKSSGHGENGGGPVSNGSLRVKFGSSAIQTYETAYLNANQEYTVTLDFSTSSSSFFFRGFLFRLSGKNGEDVEGTLVVGSDGNVSLKGSCANGISAVTHNNRDDKTSISFTFEYTESTDAELLLEVTVVRERASDNWFYSSYNIQIGDGETPQTNAPTASPTKAPTASPTKSPTKAPTKSPTKAPTKSPTASPVVSSTSSPTTSPVVSTSSPTTSPVVSTSSPTTSPVVSNTACVDFGGRIRFDKGNGQKISRGCEWAANKSTTLRCAYEGVSQACPSTCASCDSCTDPPSSLRFKFEKNGEKLTRSCEWVERKLSLVESRCALTDNICRATCGVC